MSHVDFKKWPYRHGMSNLGVKGHASAIESYRPIYATLRPLADTARMDPCLISNLGQYCIYYI